MRRSSDILDDATMALELSKMTSHAIVRVYYGLHELIDVTLSSKCIEILFERYAVPMLGWPTFEMEMGDPNRASMILDWEPQAKAKATDTFVRFCGDASSPEDSAHQPAGDLHWISDSGKDQIRMFRCTCGKVMHLYQLKRWRSRPSTVGWPRPRYGRDHIQVCRFAATADDRGHAPTEHGMQCICGGSLGVYRTRSDVTDQDQFLPLQ